jgi:polar amino acid transport system substrate-binding protein
VGNAKVRCRLLKLFALWCCISSAPAYAAELKIVFSKYTPPYVFEDGSGIIVEIVRTALEAGGHTVKPVYAPIDRGVKMFADREVDGTTIIQEASGLKAEYSDNYMQYHNRAFALRSRKLNIRDVADLGDKAVVAFQNAEKYLGPAFTVAVASNPRYKEMAQQEAQAHMLLLGRIDVAVMDEHIFRYYRQKLIAEKKADPSLEYVGYEIFPATPFKAAFWDRRIRDDFNKGIAAMRKDGRYDAIYRKYTAQYPTYR